MEFSTYKAYKAYLSTMLLPTGFDILSANADNDGNQDLRSPEVGKKTFKISSPNILITIKHDFMHSKPGSKNPNRL